MAVDERTATLTLVRDNRVTYFCSAACLAEFAEPERERRRIVRRLVVAWPATIAVLVLTYATRSPDAAYAALGLATVVQVYPALPFYRGFLDAFRSRSANMDVLIAVGTTVAYLYSAAVILTPGAVIGAYYLDASTFIVSLILTGNYLERWTRAHASGAILRLKERLPASARRVTEGVDHDVPVSSLEAGDLVRVRPGERFPVDGEVVLGSTTVDESILTGEPLPVEKGRGSKVLAGAINGNGAVEMRATGVGRDTFLARVSDLLVEAEANRVPLRRLADRIASAFVPIVFALGVGAALGWWLVGGATPTVALLVFVSTVITACPCAFGLATPAAILVGAGEAAKDGILFNGHDSIEAAAGVDVVVTDKTGTLTLGRPVVQTVVPTAGSTADDVVQLAAGLERVSTHPFAVAVVERAAQRSLVPENVREVNQLPGSGVVGRRAQNDVGVVTVREAIGRGVDLSALSNEVDSESARGASLSIVFEGKRAIGLLSYSDPVRPGARDGVETLRAAGVSVVMATGDHEDAARRVAAAVGISDVKSGLSPLGKVELVRSLRREGHRVAFVGDGINDAAALATADVGIAIGTGTDVAREAAKIVLIRSDFRAVPRALTLARRIVGRVRGNLLWAIGYNSVLIPVAAGALVPLFGFAVYAVLPIAGAAAMGVSSTTVVLSSLALRWGGRAAVRTPVVPAGATPS